ncbi:MAG TPA: VTC domain-containing protein [Vicinamibacterales bacterium]|nr:VTC domain-containing protein [Vicinamibacterales bacterium]
MTAGSSTRDARNRASEIKFLVSPDTAARLRERARALLSPDLHAGGPHSDEYTTTSLYFDTLPEFAVFGRRGSYRRAKYRVRRYGAGDVVFLERKLRTKEFVSKRRTTVHVEYLPFLMSPVVNESWSAAWFHHRLLARKLSAVVQVSYRRTARVGITDHGPIRLTVDEDLKGLTIDRPHFAPLDRALPLTTSAVVEMKFCGPMPAVFKQIAEAFALVAEPVSKYRLAIQATRPAIAERDQTARESAAILTRQI